MAKYMLSLGVIAISTCVASPSSVSAPEEVLYVTPDGSITLLGGVGYTWLKSNEITYDDFGRIGQLIWKTEAPVFTAGITAEVTDDLKMTANAAIGFAGNSHMEDYDWLDLSPSPDFSDWDHRSIHPDTDLDRYVNLDVEIGRDFALYDAVSVNLHGGLKYTNVKWTAHGGSFVYSEDSFRDTKGTFPDGERTATFEQRYPGLFLGAEATSRHGAWTLTGLVRGGATFNASDTDHHWLRDEIPGGIRFERDYSAIRFVSLGAKVDYTLNTGFSVFFGANFDKYFHKKGDTNAYAIATGELIGGPFVDGAGMDFVSTTINMGLKVTF